MAVLPYGNNLATGSVPSSGLGIDPNTGPVIFPLSAGVGITAGKTYAIVISCPTGTYVDDETNNAVVWVQDTTAGYAGGTKCINAAAGQEGWWVASATRDCYFATYDGATPKDIFTTSNAVQFVYGSYHIAQVFTASSSYTMTSVVLRLGKSSQATNPGTIYLSIKLARDAAGKASNPTPAHEASSITLDGTTVTWDAGENADSYNIYQGTLSGFLSLVASGVTDLGYALRSTNWPNYGQARYWRVDSVNDVGTTTGDEWYFTTLVFYPPTPAGVTWDDPGNAAGYTGTPLGTNNILTVRRLVGVADNCLWYET